MDDRLYELFSSLSTKIQAKIEEDLLESYDLIYNYAHRYSFREDILSELEPSTIKRLVSRYFVNIQNRYMQDMIYEIRSIFNKINEKDEKAKGLLGDNMYDVSNHLLNMTIRQGLEIFDSEFLSDFRSECWYDFRESSRENPEFESVIRTFKINLENKLEEVMEEYKRKINGYVARTTDEVKEELAKIDKEEDKVDKKEYEHMIMSIFHANKELLASSSLCADAFKDLVSFYNHEIQSSKEVSKETIKEFNKIYLITLNNIKKEKDRRLHSKFKENKKQVEQETKEEVPDYENDDEFNVSL